MRRRGYVKRLLPSGEEKIMQLKIRAQQKALVLTILYAMKILYLIGSYKI